MSRLICFSVCIITVYDHCFYAVGRGFAVNFIMTTRYNTSRSIVCSSARARRKSLPRWLKGAFTHTYSATQRMCERTLTASYHFQIYPHHHIVHYSLFTMISNRSLGLSVDTYWTVRYKSNRYSDLSLIFNKSAANPQHTANVRHIAGRRQIENFSCLIWYPVVFVL